MFSLLLVGAGQLGSRYLQGLVFAESPLEVTVVDTNLGALEMAKARWIEAGGERCHHQLHWTDSIPAELENINLALIVTSARGRADLVAQIASQARVQYWVLEKILAQSVDELSVITRATSQSQGAWVNKPMRMMHWHRKIREKFLSKTPIRASYSGGLWGLSCNSVHYLDIVSSWTGEKLISIDSSGLDLIWFESKRSGYFETTGRLVALYSQGSSLVLESRSETVSHKFQVQLADQVLWLIDETSGKSVNSDGEHIDGCFELQSQLSARLVDDILLRGRCDLPTLEESTAMHAVFLDAMLKHWNLSQNRKDLSVPIT